MSTPGPMEQSGGFPVPIGYAEATQVAQNAFEGGLIDIGELDRRLAVIAQSSSEADAWESVRDLPSESLNNTQQSKKRNSVNWVELGMSIPWYVACVATLVCVVIWGLVAVISSPTVFWPLWMSIPLIVTYAVHFAGKRFFGNNDEDLS